MNLSDAVTIAKARSYVASLADTATDLRAAVEYEQVLIELDDLYGDVVPAITVVPPAAREVVFRCAVEAIRRLPRVGFDEFDLGMCLCLLRFTWDGEHAA